MNAVFDTNVFIDALNGLEQASNEKGNPTAARSSHSLTRCDHLGNRVG